MEFQGKSKEEKHEQNSRRIEYGQILFKILATLAFSLWEQAPWVCNVCV